MQTWHTLYERGLQSQWVDKAASTKYVDLGKLIQVMIAGQSKPLK